MKLTGLFGSEKFDEAAPKKRTRSTASQRVHKVPNKTEQTKAQGAIAFGITAADYVFGTFFSGTPVFAEYDEQGLGVGQPIRWEGGLWQPQDRLDASEITLLTEAIYGEIAQKPNLVIQLAKLASAKGAHARLLQACALVALPRLARRGLLPEDMATALSLILQMAPLEDDIDGDGDGDGPGRQSGQDTAGLESGPASGGDWQDRAGQIDADRMAAETAPVRDDPQVKTGRRGVSGNRADQERGFLDEESPMAVGAGTSVLKAGNGVRESV